jgi:O-antigen/teichoic acid export membrane protein
MIVEKAGRAMSWNLVAKVARFVAMPIGYIVIVRSLGEYDWGILNILRSITGFALVFVMLGGGNALLRYIPNARVKGGMRNLLLDMRRLVALQFLVWAVLLLAVWIFGDDIAAVYDRHDARFIHFLVIAVGFVLFELMMTMVTNILQSYYETKRMSLVMVAGNVGYVILLIIFLRSGYGVIGVLAAGGLVNIGMTLTLLPKVVGLVREGGDDSANGPGITRILRFSLPFVATGILNQIVWRHSEVLFLGHFTGVVEAGYFGLAYRIPQMVLEFIPLSIWPIVMAGISETYSKDPSRLPEAIDVYFRLLFLLVVPVAALGFAFSGSLVPLLFGREMAPAARMTQLFFVVFSYSFIYTPLSMALYVMEKSWVNMLVFAVLAVLNIGLDLALIPKFGIWGAFAPVAIVMVIAVVLFRIAVNRFERGVKIPAVYIIKCFAAVLPVSIMAVSSMKWNAPEALAVQFVIGVVLLMAGLRIMRVAGEREKELIMKLPIPLKEKIVAFL